MFLCSNCEEETSSNLMCAIREGKRQSFYCPSCFHNLTGFSANDNLNFYNTRMFDLILEKKAICYERIWKKHLKKEKEMKQWQEKIKNSSRDLFSYSLDT